MMNKVCFVGRIANDLKLKTIPNTEIEVLNFSIAQDRILKRSDKDTSLFIRCMAWRKVASNIAQYCQRGSLIAIEGRLDTIQRRRNDESFQEVIIMIERVTFLSKKKEQIIDEYDEDDPYLDYEDES